MKEILTFKPYFAHVIWGGERICQFKGIPSEGTDIGESWELSPMKGHESVVAEGPHKGATLNELVNRYGDDIMGARLNKRYNGEFPLLIKFIDSRRDLSIQVHPDDELAAKRDSRGKTEMWYSIDPAEGAYLYAGFNREVTPEEFEKSIADSTIVDLLSRFPTHKGDVFFLPAGCVHAIGTGNFVVEIQEASDITYRIFDYNRVGADGKPRQLHVAQAIEATKFDDTAFVTPKNVEVAPGHEAEVVHCPFFNTDLIAVEGEMTLDLEPRDSFTVLIATEGEVTLHGPAGDVTLAKGFTALVPASVKTLALTGTGRLMSVYVP